MLAALVYTAGLVFAFLLGLGCGARLERYLRGEDP